MLTDSGGFQVWSLKDLRKITADGVEFRSHLDGSKHFFSPASVMQAEREIGADIIMAFDECTPYPSTVEEANKSLEYTLKWTREAKEWLDANPPILGYPQYFFGIVQGGMHLELRKKSIEALKEICPDGYAMGGLSVGEPAELMYQIADYCTHFLPEDRARYVMGVGMPWNLLELVRRGYLRHLFKTKEPLGWTLSTIHNLHFYIHLMQQAKAHIADDTFEEWAAEQIPLLQRNAD